MSEFRFALLGDPVAHSRSPAIHSAALAAAGLRGAYEAIRADRALLGEAVERLRAGDFHGLNITMPLKPAAAEMADDLTTPARLSGSVNTLRAVKGRVEAHSTDAVAFGELLEDARFPREAPILVLGSGSTAKAALASIGDRRCLISARSTGKAEGLVRRFDLAGLLPWGEGLEGSIVINATSLGMRGEQLPGAVVSHASALIDLPYADKPTPASSSAVAAGLPVADGIEFLVRQARASFAWWTGQVVDLEALVEAARNV